MHDSVGMGQPSPRAGGRRPPSSSAAAPPLAGPDGARVDARSDSPALQICPRETGIRTHLEAVAEPGGLEVVGLPRRDEVAVPRGQEGRITARTCAGGGRD